MNRLSFLNLWKEDQRLFAGRNSDELEFYAIHGHWPEQGVLTTAKRGIIHDVLSQGADPR